MLTPGQCRVRTYPYNVKYLQKEEEENVSMILNILLPENEDTLQVQDSEDSLTIHITRCRNLMIQIR